MISTELYTNPNFFNEGRYAPEFAQWAIETFTSFSPVLQAQQYVPNGTNLGAGKTGRVYELIENFGGLSQRRDFGGTVDAKVVEGVPKTVYMGMNSELVESDYGAEDVVGIREYERQCKMALQRLAYTFTYKLFNADVNKLDATDKKNVKNYDYDGYVKYFAENEKQVVADALVIGDIVKDVNMKFEANDFLTSTSKLVKVNGKGAEVIYCSEGADTILSALESHESDYQGVYKFTSAIDTWHKLPKVTIPDDAIPAEWKAKGEFVLFANQDEEYGNHILIPTTGELIKIREDANLGFQKVTPFDMIFAPVLVNNRAASLCFLKRKSTEE